MVKQISKEIKQTIKKKKIKYVCTICKKEFSSFEKAENCELICKNKRELYKTKPKYKAGDIVEFQNYFPDEVVTSQVYSIRASSYYTHWEYTCLSNSCPMNIKKEEELHYICSSQKFSDICENIKEDIKAKLGITKKKVTIELLRNGDIKVSYIDNVTLKRKEP